MRRFERDFRNRRPMRRSRLNENYQPLYENKVNTTSFKGVQDMLKLFSESGVEKHLYHIDSHVNDYRVLKNLGFYHRYEENRVSRLTLNDFVQKIKSGSFGIIIEYYNKYSSLTGRNEGFLLYAPNLSMNIFDGDFVVTPWKDWKTLNKPKPLDEEIIDIQGTLKVLWNNFFEQNKLM